MKPKMILDMHGTALEAAVFNGHFDILKRIGVDPARDDLNHLLHTSTFSAPTGNHPVSRRARCRHQLPWWHRPDLSGATVPHPPLV